MCSSLAMRRNNNRPATVFVVQVILKCVFHILVSEIERNFCRSVSGVIRTQMCLPVTGCKYTVFIKSTGLVQNGGIVCFSVDSRIVNLCVPATICSIRKCSRVNKKYVDGRVFFEI